MKRRKSWADKMRSPKPHQIKPAPMDIAGMRKGEIMLIPTARMIDDFIRAVEGEPERVVSRAVRAPSAQTLEAGHSPHWRLWSIIPRRAVGHTIEVNLLDAAGASLHTERLELH